METLSTINFLMAAVFAACYCYQVVFAVARLLKKRRRFTAQKLCRYAVLIAARNESAVIAQLLESIRGQNYPQDLVHIYVVADNCTDNTAQIAAACGARVFQRQNKLQVGKGFALRFLLQKIQEEYPQERYDGYFVFDADNLLDPRYITEMNKVFSSGNRVVTSYRNTKNYGDNWITAGYGLWFLRESEYLNRPRDYLGTSCAVSGTGFLFAHWSSPPTWSAAGRKSPIATTPSSTTSSPPALPSPSGSAPAGSGATSRWWPSTAAIW